MSDEYSLFYLKWIDGKRGTGSFARKFNTPAWRAWSGYALESIAQKHIHHIKAELGIAQIDTEHCSWVHRANTTWPQGAQVDLLIDRADRSINLVEIKFSEGPFTINKNYAQELRRKVQVFKDVTGTKKMYSSPFSLPTVLLQTPMPMSSSTSPSRQNVSLNKYYKWPHLEINHTYGHL